MERDQLFHRIVKPYLIRNTVNHIKKNVFTALSIARVMNLHHGFIFCGLDHLRHVEPAHFRGECMIWSSSSVKKEHIEIEKIMQDKIDFTVINDKFKKKYVDGVKFDTEKLFHYIVHHFGISEKVKHASVAITIRVYGSLLNDHGGHVIIGFKIVDKDIYIPYNWK
jgi:hypothetical protein